MSILKPAIALAIVFSAALPEQSIARCDRGDRISHSDAGCLWAKWYNPSGLLEIGERRWFEVMNVCARRGKVVTKVDIEGEMDRTLHLTNSKMRYGKALGRIRGIYCCADLSHLCSP